MQKTLPSWASDPFYDFLDHAETLRELLHISMRGICLLQAIPNTIQVLRDTASPAERDRYSEASLKRAVHEASLAKNEVETGFPLLHAQSAISLWASLEALIREFLAKWLANIDEARKIDELKKVRIRIGEYESIPADERPYYLLDLLEEAMGTRRGPGIARFESLFNAFGLYSDIGEDVRRNLLELYHVRNLLVHRRGVADRKFVESCPWVDIEIGSRMTVSRDAIGRYDHAAGEYVLELIQRMRVYFGLGRYESKDVVCNAQE